MTKYNKLFFVITEVVQTALVLSIGVDAQSYTRVVVPDKKGMIISEAYF